MMRFVLHSLVVMLTLGFILAPAVSGPHYPSLLGGTAGQTMTVLPDGRWLLVGGEDPEGPRATMMFWDPRTQTTSLAAHALHTPRAWHTATVLPDGTVLIVGGLGVDGRVVEPIEVWDPATERLTTLPAGNITPRTAHTATLLTDGRVLLVGGRAATGEALDTAELWDPQTQTMIPVAATLTTARYRHTALLLADGAVLLAGGRDQAGVTLANEERYDPTMQHFHIVDTPRSTPGTTQARRPRLVASLPADGDRDVPVDSLIAVRFNKPLLQETVTAATVVLTGLEARVTTTVIPAEDGMLAFVTPQTLLLPETTYTLTLSGLSDAFGHRLAVTTMHFTTAAASGMHHHHDHRAMVSMPHHHVTAPSASMAATGVTPADEDQGTMASSHQHDRRHPHWQSLPPLQAAPGVTALAGQVLTLRGPPLAGVTLRLGEVTAQTDTTGRFLLSVLPQGRHTLLIDGRSARQHGRTYGVFAVGVELLAQQTTMLPYTIWMPQLDLAHAVTLPSPTPAALVLSTPHIPGLEVHVPAGTVIRDHEGRVVTQLSITPMPLDRPPFPLPDEAHIPVYFTIQPGLASINSPNGEGLRLVYPNGHRRPPGSRFTLWHHQPTAEGWSVHGFGTATADGQQIVPDPEVGLQTVTVATVACRPDPSDIFPSFGSGAPGSGPGAGGGSGGNGGPPDGSEDGPGADNGEGRDGDPVDLATGLFVLHHTDLFVPAPLPIALRRTYRPNDEDMRAFGRGMTHAYDLSLEGDSQAFQKADLILPDGGRVAYVRTSPGTSYTDAVLVHTATPTKFYRSELRWTGSLWALTLRDGTVYEFLKARLNAIRTRAGHVVMLTRDNIIWSKINRIIALPGNRQITLTYDASNRITRVQDHSGRAVLYTYDPAGRLSTVTDPMGGVTTYTYDAQHRLVTIKDARGIVFLTNFYTALGEVSRQILANGASYQFAYTKNAEGRIVATRVTQPGGAVRRVTFDAQGYLLSDTTALGTPAAQTTTYVRQAGSHLVLSTTDTLGRTTAYTYDAWGKVTSVTLLAGTAEALTTTWTYEPQFHQVQSVIDPLGQVTTGAYDSRGNLLTVSNALHQTTSFTYNNWGQRLTHSDPLGHITTFTYNTAGDLIAVTDPLGHTTTGDRDSLGRLVRQTTPLGHITQYTYDAHNRLTQIIDPLGGRTALTYDPNGNLRAVIDARGAITSYDYDNMDSLIQRTDPLLRSERFVYDAVGNPTQGTDRKGQRTLLAYDVLQRRTQATYADSSTIAYTYDAGDRLTQVLDSQAGAITRTYNALDRLDSETTPQGTVHYTYDTVGRRTSMTVAGQPPVVYSYDALSRLTQLTQGAATVTLTYDAAGRRTRLTLPNGVAVTSGYDGASQLASLSYTQGTTVLGTLTYTYDAEGRRVAVGGTWARTSLPQAMAMATYHADNQQRTFGTRTLTHDRNGSLTTLTAPAGPTTYTWDARQQLVALTGPGLTASFAYDGLGRRTRKTVNGLTTTVLADGVTPVQEHTSGAGTATLLTGLGMDEYFTRTDATGTATLLSDALGSTVALSDPAGTVRTTYTYEPFGATTVQGTPATNALQYTGREDDGTGLYYYRARYYSPTLQHFLSPDPLGFAGGDVNLYAYVGNSPTMARDPSGLCVDVLADVGFILYDLYALITGGRKELGGNLAALGGDVLGAFTPFVTGLGQVAKGAKTAGKVSRYEEVTAAGSRYINRATDVARGQFENNLLDAGWTRTVSKDNKVCIFEKDGSRYILRDGAKSTGRPTADFYKPGSKSIDLKIRLD